MAFCHISCWFLRLLDGVQFHRRKRTCSHQGCMLIEYFRSRDTEQLRSESLKTKWQSAMYLVASVVVWVAFLSIDEKKHAAIKAACLGTFGILVTIAACHFVDLISIW